MAVLKYKNPSTGQWEGIVGGSQGASAYEIAVQNGFIGTEQEWLDSLNGAMADLVTQENNGLMSAEDKTKLDNVNIDTNPAVSSFKNIQAGTAEPASLPIGTIYLQYE